MYGEPGSLQFYDSCTFLMRTVVTVVMLLVVHDMVVVRSSVLIDDFVVFFRLWPIWLGRMMECYLTNVSNFLLCLSVCDAFRGGC